MTLNRDDYDRVTTILKPFSGMDKIDPIVLSNAADRGTWLHEVADEWINNTPLYPELMPKNWVGYFYSFVKWAEDKKFLPKPERMYCDELKITGEIDGLYEQDGKIYLYDLKTSSSQGCTWPQQGSAYSYLCKKMGYQIDGIRFIQIKKEGKEPIVRNYAEDLETFFSCLTCYRLFFKKTNNNNDILEENI